MIRVTKQYGKYYGVEFESVEDEVENIEYSVKDGFPVIIVENLSDIDKMDLTFTSQDIEMVS